MKSFHFFIIVFLVLSLFSCRTEGESELKFDKNKFTQMMSEWENEKPEKYSFHYEVSTFMPRTVCADVTVDGNSKAYNLTKVYEKRKEQYGTENLEEYLEESDKIYCFSSFEEINNFILSYYESMDSSKYSFTIRWKSEYCYYISVSEIRHSKEPINGDYSFSIEISDLNLQ